MINRRRLYAAAFVGLLILLALAISIDTGSDDRTRTTQAPAVAAKVYVTEEGMYELKMADLEAVNLGWHDIDPTQLRLFHQGREEPLWVPKQADPSVLRFYGQARQNRYGSENVYWLRPGNGATSHMETRSAKAEESRSRVIETYIATAHVEENKLYAPRAEGDDHWFWAMLPAPRSQSFDVNLTDLADGRSQLQLAVWASSEAPVSPDHHLRISVNGQLVADETWDGSGHRTIKSDLPENVLTEGANTVEIEAPGDTDAGADITYVNSIVLRYPRFLIAEEDRLAFEGSTEPQRLKGFSGQVAIFDVTDPQVVTRVTNVQQETQGQQTLVYFQGKAGRRYLGVGPTGFRVPGRISRAATTPDLHTNSNGADYVAVGPADLLEPLQPLLEWRTEQQLEVMAIPVEAVYDQFNHGLPHPRAISAFLKHAVQSWEPAPQFLLLVGDATYDTREYSTPPGANRLPTFLVPTVFGGETASDIAFAQLNDDPWPDIAVGRMPARTPEQIRVLVEKTLDYEKRAKKGEWQRRILTVADGQDASFRRDAQAFVDLFPTEYQAVEVYPSAGTADVNQEIRRKFEEGNLLVAYFGHGSVTQWGKDRLFTATDSATLTNSNRLPVVVNMTCLTGLFTHPKVDSLAETLLWQQDGGAVATLAPTSLTLPTDQSFLSQALIEGLLRHETPILGQAVLQAQRQVPADKPSTRDVMQTFLLFGDPALHLAIP